MFRYVIQHPTGMVLQNNDLFGDLYDSPFMTSSKRTATGKITTLRKYNRLHYPNGAINNWSKIYHDDLKILKYKIGFTLC